MLTETEEKILSKLDEFMELHYKNSRVNENFFTVPQDVKEARIRMSEVKIIRLWVSSFISERVKSD